MTTEPIQSPGNEPVESDHPEIPNAPESVLELPAEDALLDVRGRRPLVFCGMCGALNPATNFYCAACGTTLIDAFHATEGLRVFERPDSASRLIEIVPSGKELEVVEDTNAPEDFIRVRLEYGRLGYIRLQDVATMAQAAGTGSGTPSAADLAINTDARGCVGPTGALAAIGLVVILGALMIAIIARSDIYDQGTLGIVFCLGLGPLLVLTVGLYLYARGREERFMAAEDEREAGNRPDA